jgi:hypothetical protein
MAKRAVLHLKKGKTWLLHTGNRNRSLVRKNGGVFVPDDYGDAGLSAGSSYGINLHAYPLEIVDVFGHYFLPVEKAA